MFVLLPQIRLTRYVCIFLHINVHIVRILFHIKLTFQILLFFCQDLKSNWILPTYANYLKIRISSLIGEVWAHRTSLTPPLFIEEYVPSQESERSCICELVLSILSFSTIFLLDFGQTEWTDRMDMFAFQFSTL